MAWEEQELLYDCVALYMRTTGQVCLNSQSYLYLGWIGLDHVVCYGIDTLQCGIV